MADDRYDQLLEVQQIRQQAAHQRYVQGLQNQAQANLHDYQQAIAENDMNAAAFAESEYRKNTRELAEMTGGQAAQQAQGQQYAQPQLSEVEMNILREFPHIASDPKKSAEAIGKADALVAKHVHDARARGEAPNPNYRNSPEYDSALRIGIGVTASDGISPGAEIASADAAVEATRGSKYMKDFDRRQYDAYAQYRDQLKARGFYRLDDTP